MQEACQGGYDERSLLLMTTTAECLGAEVLFGVWGIGGVLKTTTLRECAGGSPWRETQPEPISGGVSCCAEA